MVVFVRFLDYSCVVVSFSDRRECSGEELKKEILKNQCLPVEVEDLFFLSHNGRILSSDSILQLDQYDGSVSCHARLPGGKGGFGSMLRAIGAQIEKTTNREACRDLSGRRMRDVNDEKKIADWLAKKSEREEEKARLKRERLEKLRSSPKHVFEDSNQYTSQLQENLESVEDALQTGLKSAPSTSSSSLGKRKADKSRKKHSKKQKLWLGIDEELSSESDEESDVGSSCSSVADSSHMGSEASSMASGRTSESETSEIMEHEDNPRFIPEETKENVTHSVIAGEKVTSTASSSTVSMTTVSSSAASTSTITSSSVSSRDVDTDDNKSQIILKSKDRKADEEQKIASSNVVAESEAKVDIEKDKPIPRLLTEPLDINQYNSKEELEELGLDVLKSALMARGLKCGGTLQQRAERLFSTKGIPQDKIDPSLLAKPSGKRQRKGK